MVTTKKTIKKPTTTTKRKPLVKPTPAKLTSMWQYLADCMTTKYCDFKGRATRKEYWSFIIFYCLYYTIPTSIVWLCCGVEGLEYTMYLLIAGTILPWLSLVFRRMHDVNLSAWWYMLNTPAFVLTYIFLYINTDLNQLWSITIIPASILSIYITFWRGTKGKNKYGADLLK